MRSHHTHTHTHQLPPTPDRSAGWIRKTLATSAARSQTPERASEREWKRRRRRRRREYVVGVLDGLGLAALVEVGGEAEAALGVLDDAAELAPPPERLLRRVLRLHPAEILLQVALHPPPPTSTSDQIHKKKKKKENPRLQHAVAGWLRLRLRLRRAPSLPAAWPLRRGDEEEEEVRWRWR
jgi:ribosomal protein S30